MQRLFLTAGSGILLALVWCGCAEDEPVGRETPPPWWILNVYVVEATGESPEPAVHGCPTVRWHIFPLGEFQEQECTVENRVKLWDHMEASFSIEFQVLCEGYRDSEFSIAFFDSTEIRILPGRAGPECEQNRTVRMTRE